MNLFYLKHKFIANTLLFVWSKSIISNAHLWERVNDFRRTRIIFFLFGRLLNDNLLAAGASCSQYEKFKIGSVPIDECLGNIDAPKF